MLLICVLVIEVELELAVRLNEESCDKTSLLALLTTLKLVQSKKTTKTHQAIMWMKLCANCRVYESCSDYLRHWSSCGKSAGSLVVRANAFIGGSGEPTCNCEYVVVIFDHFLFDLEMKDIHITFFHSTPTCNETEHL